MRGFVSEQRLWADSAPKAKPVWQVDFAQMSAFIEPTGCGSLIWKQVWICRYCSYIFAYFFVCGPLGPCTSTHGCTWLCVCLCICIYNHMLCYPYVCKRHLLVCVTCRATHRGNKGVFCLGPECIWCIRGDVRSSGMCYHPPGKPTEHPLPGSPDWFPWICPQYWALLSTPSSPP